MDKNKFSHKTFLSSLFFCITLLVYATCFMFENGGITYDSVVGVFVNILPFCIILAMLGYVIGGILDKPKKLKINPKYDQNMIDKLVQDLSEKERVDAQEINQAHLDKLAALDGEPPVNTEITPDLDIKPNIEI